MSIAVTEHNRKLTEEILPKHDDLISYLRTNTPYGMLPTLQQTKTNYEYEYHESGRINILATRLIHTGFIDHSRVVRTTIEVPVTALIMAPSYFSEDSKLRTLLDMIAQGSGDFVPFTQDSSLNELFIKNGKTFLHYCMTECYIKSMFSDSSALLSLDITIDEMLTWTINNRVGDNILECIRIIKLALYLIDLGYHIKDEDFAINGRTNNMYVKLVKYIKDYYGSMHENEYVLK